MLDLPRFTTPKPDIGEMLSELVGGGTDVRVGTVSAAPGMEIIVDITPPSVPKTCTKEANYGGVHKRWMS